MPDLDGENPENRARRELRARLGQGARFDAPNAPQRELLWARRGAAYFARKLNELSDRDLDVEDRASVVGRRQTVALVSYHARYLAERVASARIGKATGQPYSDAERREDIALGITLPAQALRNLYHHSDVHLNVEWRDLAPEQWEAGTAATGAESVPAHTVWLRARAIWLGAVDLDNGGSFNDFPPDFVQRLLADAVAARGAELDAYTIVTINGPDRSAIREAGAAEVSGSSRNLARWLHGRGHSALSFSCRALPELSFLAATLRADQAPFTH